MANIDKLIPHIIKWEGGAKYTNDPLDRGGATKYGITIGTLQGINYDTNHDGKVNVDDVKTLQLDDFKKILKRQYWDRWQADKINNQSIANLLVDWLWVVELMELKYLNGSLVSLLMVLLAMLRLTL